jgi:DNA-binding transcriptional regulator YdaS (Cro superfamily)
MPHLREWLRKEDESQADFAQRIGVDKSTVGRWIDEVNPTLPSRGHMKLIKAGTRGEVTARDMSDGYFGDETAVEIKQPALDPSVE